MSTAAPSCPHASGNYHGFEPFKLTSPFAAWEELREEAPVFYDDRIGYYVVSRYADVKGVFADWETFSSANAQSPINPVGAVLDDLVTTRHTAGMAKDSGQQRIFSPAGRPASAMDAKLSLVK